MVPQRNLNIVQDNEQPMQRTAGFPDLGTRLRTIRELHGLSQRALAKAAGVTNATISNIEQNHVSPSVASLRKVSRAMGLTLADFFSWDSSRPQCFFYRADDLEEIVTGGVTLRLVAAADPERALQLQIERYEPGADTGPEMLQYPGEEAGVVLRGYITITVGGQTATLGPGEAFQFPRTLPHRFVNDSDEPCELVSAATPPSL